jgi:pimeloyl-ACP methyl ester carboxylesterase
MQGVALPLIHHGVTGQGRPPIVFVHGFGCAHSDWDAQVANFAPRHLTVAVDLRRHGAGPGTPKCSIGDTALMWPKSCRRCPAERSDVSHAE